MSRSSIPEDRIRDFDGLWSPYKRPEPIRPGTLAALDPGIAYAVKVLIEAGVETFESCEGGEGHAYPEPTVAFGSDGWHALSVALTFGLPVRQLNRYWTVGRNGEPCGPEWQLVFREQVPLPEPAP